MLNDEFIQPSVCLPKYNEAKFSLLRLNLEQALSCVQELTEHYLLCIQQGTAAQACVTQADPEGRGKAPS